MPQFWTPSLCLVIVLPQRSRRSQGMKSVLIFSTLSGNDKVSHRYKNCKAPSHKITICFVKFNKKRNYQLVSEYNCVESSCRRLGGACNRPGSAYNRLGDSCRRYVSSFRSVGISFRSLGSSFNRPGGECRSLVRSNISLSD